MQLPAMLSPLALHAGSAYMPSEHAIGCPSAKWSCQGLHAVAPGSQEAALMQGLSLTSHGRMDFKEV